MDISTYGLVPHDCSTVKPGQRFGRIVILATGKLPNSYKYKAIYRCDCGTVRMTQCGTIQIGNTLSCGCKNREELTKHGLWDDPLYRVWHHMMQRCYDKKTQRFIDYGARGIAVCERWHDVSAFHADMSEGFAKDLQIDRIDNNLNYSPGNCRWLSRHAQMRNRRNNIFVTIDGETKILKDWSIHFGVNYHSVYHRVKKMGWEPELALRTPFLTKDQPRRLARPQV